MLSVKSPRGDAATFKQLPQEDSAESQPLKQLLALFAAALTQSSNDRDASWQLLFTHLESLPRTNLNQLRDLPEVQHYIHRTVQHAAKHFEELKHLSIIEKLAALFPNIIQEYEEKDLPYSYSYSDIDSNFKSSQSSSKARKKHGHNKAATVGSSPAENPLFNYSPPRVPATFRGPQINVADLAFAANIVSDELTSTEKSISLHLRQGTLSRHQDRPPSSRLRTLQRVHHRSVSGPQTSRESEQVRLSVEKPLLNPLLSSEVGDAHFHKVSSKTLFPKQQRSPTKQTSPTQPSTCTEQVPLQLNTAYDVIEAFSSGRLQSESESIHLNYTNPSKWSPYDLTVVPKTKVTPEHFVISKFGILCVYSDGTSDLQNFADWLREANLYKMLRQIPFLKQYKLKKALKNWHKNVKQIQFSRILAQISNIGIRHFPLFAKALFKIQSLSEELLTIQFHHLSKLGSHSVESYQHSLQGSHVNVLRFLQRYFKYCKRIVNEVIETTQKRALDLKTEMHHKPFISDLPLSVQREQHAQLERDMEYASYQADRLNDFVKIAEQIVYSCLLNLARQASHSWIDTALYCDEAQQHSPRSTSVLSDDGSANIIGTTVVVETEKVFLSIDFVFNESGILATYPTTSDLHALLTQPLQRIVEVFSAIVQPLTGKEGPTTECLPPSNSNTPTETFSTLPGSVMTPLVNNKDNMLTPQDRHSPEATASRKTLALGSVAPLKQPKSLLRVLQGLSVTRECDDGGPLQSDRARSQLAASVATEEVSVAGGRFGGSKQDGSSCLDGEKFIAKIREDPILQKDMDSMQHAVMEVCSSVGSLCEQYKWMNDMWTFINSWEGKKKAAIMTAEEFEVTLNLIFEWLRLLKLLPPYLTTPHLLVGVMSGAVMKEVQPNLTFILDQLKATGILQARTLCERVLEETREKAEVLSSKRYDLEGFAEYAHHLRECQTFDENEATNINYVLRVHSILFHHGIDVPQQDKILGKQLKVAWHSFEEKLKEAENFVTTQTPVKAQGLQEYIQSCEDELRGLISQVNVGKFIDCNGQPSELLEELKVIQEEVLTVRSRLLGLSKWKEAISGKPHDITGISNLLDQLYTRQEVWKYRRVFDGNEHEWMKTPFKRLNIQLVTHKVSNWLSVCPKLAKTLPPDDPVLEGWRERLENFQAGIPLLQQLSSKALRASHWYTIFASLGEEYNPSTLYTLNDFALYNIYKHSDIIFEICHDAMQEDKLRAQVNEMQENLLLKSIKITQCAVERYPFAVHSFIMPTVANERSRVKLPPPVEDSKPPGVVPGKKSGDKITSFALTFQPVSNSSVEYLYSVENDTEICVGLENDVIQLKMLLASPHLGILKAKAESLMKTLIQLQELMGLLSDCQSKWQQLLSLFSDVSPSQYVAMGIAELQQATTKYQDVTSSIRDDSRLLSLLGKRRGQKGFRELQGEALRQTLYTVLSKMETVTFKAQLQLDDGCAQFPRLCYLPDNDILKVVSHSGNPVPILPLITRVFPAIKSIRFIEIAQEGNPTEHQKSDSKEGWHLVGIEGHHGEYLPLTVPLPLGARRVPKWLHALESAISYSLGSVLTECYSTLPDSIMGINTNDQDNGDLEQWISSHINQCVVLSLELKWTAELYNALTSDEPIFQLKMIVSRLQTALDIVIEAMLKGANCKHNSLKCFKNIILTLKHKLDIVKSLLESDEPSLSSFQWKCHLHYSMDSSSLYEDSKFDKVCSLPRMNARDRGSTNSVYSLSTSSRPNLMIHKAISKSSVLGSHKLQGSTQSLVASSKSLLNNISNANTAIVNELQKSGASSLVLSSDLTTSRQPLPPTKCMVHCSESIIQYGFEYHGITSRLVLTPNTESSILLLANALARYTFPSVSGAPCVGKSDITKETAKLLGRHYYHFSCSPQTSLSTLHQLLRGALGAGSILLLENYLSLEPCVMISLGECLGSLALLVAKTFKGKQSSIILSDQPKQTETHGHSEITLTATSHSSLSSTPLPPPPQAPDHHSTTTTTAPVSTHTSKHTSSQSHHHPHHHHHSDNHPSVTTADMTRIPSRAHTPSHPLSMTHSRTVSQRSHHLSVLDQQHQSSPVSRATTRIDWYKITEEGVQESDMGWFGYGGGARSNVEFLGGTLQVSPAFGCVFVDTRSSTKIDLPEQLKSTLHPMAIVAPDAALIAEALLLSGGFSEVRKLGRNLASLIDQLKCQLSTSNVTVAASLGIPSMKLIIMKSATLLRQYTCSDGLANSYEMECQAIAQSLLQYFHSQVMSEEPEDQDGDDFEGQKSINLDLTNWKKIADLVTSYFPTFDDEYDNDTPISEVDNELLEAIKSQLLEDHFQRLPLFLEKVKQLHTTLQHSQCVLLAGAYGSGKTTCYKVLAAAYRYIRELRALGKQSTGSARDSKRGNTQDYPQIDITVLNPAAYSISEFIGSYRKASSSSGDGTQWRDGILTRLIRQMQNSDNVQMLQNHPEAQSSLTIERVAEDVIHWVVLDGLVDPSLLETLQSLSSSEGMTLPNGEKIKLPESCKLLVETSTLPSLTPSFPSHCSMIHFRREVLTYDTIIDTWLDRAPMQHNLSAMSTETLASMIKQVLPETLEYLQETNTKHSGAVYTEWSQAQVYGLTETQCFLNLLSAILERNAPKVETALTYTGTASQLHSRPGSSSRLSEVQSRASSVMWSASMTSVPSFTSKSNMYLDNDPLDPMDDDISECSNLEAEFALSMQLQMASMLAFAYIWSLGAFIPLHDHASFSDFARDQIMQLPFAVPLPEEGSVFDYFLDLNHYQFIPWSDRKGSAKHQSRGYISSSEVERYAYIVDLYLSYGLNVMIIGGEGTGKTSFVEHLIQARLPLTRLPITHTLTPLKLQQNLLNRMTQLEKRVGQRLGGASKKTSSVKNVFFLDDIHLASQGTQSRQSLITKHSPLLEIVRFAVNQKQLVELQRDYRHMLYNVRYIASSVPGEYWRLPIQLCHSFNPIPFFPPSDAHLHRVFSQSVLLWLQQFPDTALGDPELLASALGAASITVFRSVSNKFDPSPSQPHHLYTMHDLLHVYEGLLLLSPDAKAQTQPQFSLLHRRGFFSSTQSGKTARKKSSSKTKGAKRNISTLPSLKETERGGMKTRRRPLPEISGDGGEMVSTLRMLIRLWCHETTRVFLDRIVDSRERMWFLKLLETCIKYCFCGVTFQGSKMDQQSLSSHTASYGGARGRLRGARARGGVLAQASSADSLNLEELASSAIEVDTLQKLMRGESAEDSSDETSVSQPKKFIGLDQVVVRGEDLTGLMFAHFPSPTQSHGNSSTSVDEEHETSRSDKDGSTPSTHLSQTTSNTYHELGDGQVMEILKKFQMIFQSGGVGHNDDDDEEDMFQRSEDSELVLFRGAIEHVTRINRIMSLPGSHAILLGVEGSGRKSLVRLMAHIMNAKLFELGMNSDNVRHLLRDVCISAALESRNTVLVVSNSSTLQSEDWEDICRLMKDGLCPNLFTSSELLVMSNKLQRDKVKKTTEGAQRAFARAVCSNLYVFIIWDIDSGTGSLFTPQSSSESGLFSTLPCGQEVKLLSLEEASRALFTSLCQSCSYIDHYQPWSKQAYCDIALKWWQNETGVVASRHISWQDWVDTSSQLEAIGNLAAHVHLTTTELLSRVYGGHSCDLVSPKTFIECLRMTENIATKLKQEEKTEAEKLQVALGKLEVVDHTVYELEQQLGTLRPQLAVAEQEVQYRMGLITSAKERYMEANQRCKFAEETIQTETTNVEQFTKVVEEKFNEVAPMYHSALEALSSVQKNDLLEVMSYRDPPELLMPVFDALCMIFDREKTWESCKQLLISPKFFESLRFFDRDNVPKYKLKRLEKMAYIKSKFSNLEKGSKAVMSLCMWLTALVDYHNAKLAVKPFKERLAEAERILTDAKKTFVAMRKDMMETKHDLESTVKLHRESVQKARAIEMEIEATESKLESANLLLFTMATQRRKWEEKLNSTLSKMDSVPGHALLCASNACYLARVPPDKHSTLFHNWLGYCSGSVSLGSLGMEQSGLQSAQGYHVTSGRQQVVRIQKDFSLSSHLSLKEEQSYWQQESIFPDQITLERCLGSRSSCTQGCNLWPLVFDPHGHFEKYLRAMSFTSPAQIEASMSASSRKTDSSHFPVNLDVSDSHLGQTLSVAMIRGKTVLLVISQYTQPVCTDNDMTLLVNTMMREFTFNGETEEHHIEYCGESLTVHPNFRLYVVIEQSLESIFTPSSVHQKTSKLDHVLCPQNLSNFSVVNLESSREGLQNYMQKFVITHEKPEYGVRYKSLLTDLTLHQKQLEHSQEHVLECALATQLPLNQTPTILEAVKDSEVSESNALELITETKKNLRVYDQQALAYKPLSEYASLIVSTVQNLATKLNYFSFKMSDLERILESLITSSVDSRVPDNVMSVNAHVLCLKHHLLSSVYRTLQVRLFQRHQVLLPLLVELEVLLNQGKLSPQEFELLCRDLAGVEAKLEMIVSDEKSSSSGPRTPNTTEKPSWVTDMAWCQVLQIQKQLQSFRRLPIEVATNSSEWKEYFDMVPSLMAPLPNFGDNFSTAQKLLIWKVFKPQKFFDVCKEFIMLTAGAEFTSSVRCSISKVLPHTQPHLPIICMLSSPPNSTTERTSSRRNPAALLETSATCFKRGFQSLLLISDDHVESLVAQLPQMACCDQWVVLEHCQLYNQWKDSLEQIAKLLDSMKNEVHPDFRLWALLPVEDCIKTGVPLSCQQMALEWPDQLDDSSLGQLSSIELLEDLKHVYTDNKLTQHDTKRPATTATSTTRREPGLLLKWENCKPMILKLSTLIPSPLSYSELTELTPQQEPSQSPLSLIHEELCVLNFVLTSLHCSLKILSDFLQGVIPFSQAIGNILSWIQNSTLPSEWCVYLPTPLNQMCDLVSFLKLLRARNEFYLSTLSSGALPLEINPLLLSTPSEVVSRILHKFATDLEVSPDEVQVTAKLVRNTEVNSEVMESLHHHSAQPFIVFSDLYLQGAVWDEQKHILSPIASNHSNTDNVSSTSIDLCSENTRSYSAVVTVTLVSPKHHRLLLQEDTNSLPTSVFHCPVTGSILRDESRGELSNGYPLLFTVPLPCVTPELNTWKRVYLCHSTQGSL